MSFLDFLLGSTPRQIKARRRRRERRLSKRKARKLRKRIAANRCPDWPGITHHWEDCTSSTPGTYGLGITERRCAKCLQPERVSR